MRVLVAILMLVLAGCADYPEFEAAPLVEPPQPAANTTAMPVNATPEAPTYPVASIATATLTAPINLTLHRMEGDAATLLLIADPQGLRCVSIPHGDPQAAPAGYKATSSWARCSLTADGAQQSSAQAASMSSDMPLIQGIPVEAFTWNMSVGQVLVNNTGEHEAVRDEVSQTITAAPSLQIRRSIHQDGLRTSSSYVCDTLTTWGPATVSFAAEAHNGRAVLMVDTAGFDVQSVQASGAEVAPENVTDHGTNATWWQKDGVVTVLGSWDQVSEARLDLIIDFRGHGNTLAILPPPDCPDAMFIDRQPIPHEASAIGIAAGWEDALEQALDILVWHL